MARLNCTSKWQGKSEHLNEKTKVDVLMGRLNCTSKLQLYI